MDDAPGQEAATLALVDLAAAIASGQDHALRAGIAETIAAGAPATWVEELILQSVLMVGWPRTLAAAAAWREISGLPAPDGDPGASPAFMGEWEARGEATCRTVYGSNYARLRENVRALHPALDQWMVTEGYGRTLSRPGLDLRRRELCTVAQCAVQATLPQLHSHLRGARHAGATPADLRAALGAAERYNAAEFRDAANQLLERVLA